MIHSLSISEQSISISQVVKMTEILKSFKIEKFFDLSHSRHWQGTEPYFKLFTEVAIFEKSVISFQACKNLQILQLHLKSLSSLVELADILRGSMNEAQFINLTLRVLNSRGSQDDWSMLWNANEIIYNMKAKQENPIFIKKLLVDNV